MEYPDTFLRGLKSRPLARLAGYADETEAPSLAVDDLLAAHADCPSRRAALAEGEEPECACSFTAEHVADMRTMLAWKRAKRREGLAAAVASCETEEALARARTRDAQAKLEAFDAAAQNGR